MATAIRVADDRVEACTAELLANGYCILPDLVPAATVAALDQDLRATFDRTPFCQGDFYGERTKRFGSLLARSHHTAAFVQHPVILGAVERVLDPGVTRSSST
jgi:hypothetical protein